MLCNYQHFILLTLSSDANTQGNLLHKETISIDASCWYNYTQSTRPGSLFSDSGCWHKHLWLWHDLCRPVSSNIIIRTACYDLDRTKKIHAKLMLIKGTLFMQTAGMQSPGSSDCQEHCINRSSTKCCKWSCIDSRISFDIWCYVTVLPHVWV